jgi:hypothetical protein
MLGVRISNEARFEERQHGITHPRVCGRRGLIVEVNRIGHHTPSWLPELMTVRREVGKCSFFVLRHWRLVFPALLPGRRPPTNGIRAASMLFVNEKALSRILRAIKGPV